MIRKMQSKQILLPRTQVPLSCKCPLYSERQIIMLHAGILIREADADSALFQPLLLYEIYIFESSATTCGRTMNKMYVNQTEK